MLFTKVSSKLLGLIIAITLILSFTIAQIISQEEELIFGTWISTDEPEWKWVFKTDGKCYDYYNSALEGTYYFSITEEQSKNKKLTLSFLKLINIKNSDEVFEYEINALNDTNLTLEYLGGIRGKLTYFTKE